MIPGWGRVVAGFRELAAEAGVTLSEVLYVGDHTEGKQAARDAGVIAVEDIHVNRMLYNHCLAKSISDVAWSQFDSLLAYK